MKKEVWFYAYTDNSKQISLKVNLKQAHTLYDQFKLADDFNYIDITINGKVLRSHKKGYGRLS